MRLDGRAAQRYYRLYVQLSCLLDMSDAGLSTRRVVRRKSPDGHQGRRSVSVQGKASSHHFEGIVTACSTRTRTRDEITVLIQIQTWPKSHDFRTKTNIVPCCLCVGMAEKSAPLIKSIHSVSLRSSPSIGYGASMIDVPHAVHAPA